MIAAEPAERRASGGYLRRDEHAGPDPTTGRSGTHAVRAGEVVAQTLATHAVLTVTAIAGLVLAVGLTVASSSIYEAVVDNDGIAALDSRHSTRLFGNAP